MAVRSCPSFLTQCGVVDGVCTSFSLATEVSTYSTWSTPGAGEDNTEGSGAGGTLGVAKLGAGSAGPPELSFLHRRQGVYSSYQWIDGAGSGKPWNILPSLAYTTGIGAAIIWLRNRRLPWWHHSGWRTALFIRGYPLSLPGFDYLLETLEHTR